MPVEYDLGRFAGQIVAAQILGGRDRQEDDFAIVHLADEGVERLVIVVADGMGGRPGAAEVAQIAVRCFCAAIKIGQGSLTTRLRPALEYANAEIALAGARDPKIRGAGCTLVAAAIENDMMSWISVGDSSVYLFRNRILHRLNGMPPAFANVPSLVSVRAAANVLPALIGAELDFVTMPPQPLRISAHDAIVVASDGLDCLGDLQVERILRRAAKLSAKMVVERLLSSVQSRPVSAQDNTTIIFCRVPASTSLPKSSFSSLKKSVNRSLSWLWRAYLALLVMARQLLLQ